MTGFTEFNRNRPPLDAVDFVTHVTSAIVHSADDRSVVETLEALPHVFRSAQAIARGKPYRIGPSGIGLGLNPDGPPRRADASRARATMICNDPRQRGLFAAAWTLAYAVAVIAHDVAEYAPAHIAGDFGIFDDDGALRPIYHVVRALATHQGATASELSGLPRGCRGIAIGDRFWVANLTAESRHVDFDRPRRSKSLDTRTFEAARHDAEFFAQLSQSPTAELKLLPFAVAQVAS